MYKIMGQNMKIKKHILHTFILLVLMLSITAISAADLNDTDNTAGDVLTEMDSEDESFMYFQTEMEIQDSTFDLKYNYKFDNESDLTYAGGINVTKDNFIINGNNHVIDCDNQARALTITGKNVVINNLTIKNGYYNFGSAINSKSKLTLNNVTIINCTCTPNSNYGAVYINNNTLIANNCKFIDNAGNQGASITAYYSTVKLTNSTFISNSDAILKGHIYLYMTNATIDNCDFLNTTSKYAAAIFANDKVKLDISNSRFKNLHANKTAGAIAAKQITSLSISDSEFDNDTSENNGGAIFVDADGDLNKKNPMNTTITTTTFNNCYSGFGGQFFNWAET